MRSYTGLGASNSHQSIEIGLPLIPVRSTGLCVHTRGDVYQRETRHDVLPVLHHALVLRRGRHSGGQPGGPEDERQRRGVAGRDTEQPYKFLDKGNREEISSDSKVTTGDSKGILVALAVRCMLCASDAHVHALNFTSASRTLPWLARE